MMRTSILAINIIQNAKPKNEVQTNVEGLINGQIAHNKADKKATKPIALTRNLPNIFKKDLFLFLSIWCLLMLIIFYFV